MHKVYNHENFYPQLNLDLKEARFLVLIQSPFMSVKRINKLRAILAECVTRGVRVCVFAQKIDRRYLSLEDYEQKRDALELASQRLLSIGVHVNLVKGIHEKLILVDENVLWEGSLNTLSHRDTSERMTRWECLHKVHDAFIEHNLNKCVTCRNFSFEGDIQDVVGSIIYKRRKQLNLSQSELSKMTKFSQHTISKIERGKVDCKLSTVLQLLKVLDLHLQPLPWFMTPVIDSQLHQAFAETKQLRQEDTKAIY